MSQESNASYSSQAAAKEAEKNLAIGFYKKFLAKQRGLINKFNKEIEKGTKDRDEKVKQTIDSNLEIYDQAIKSAREYFSSSQDAAIVPFYASVSNVEEFSLKLIAELEEDVYRIDPDDAEEMDDKLTHEYAIDVRKTSNWRRSLVKKNHKEVELHKEKLKNKVKPEEMTQAISTLVNVS